MRLSFDREKCANFSVRLNARISSDIGKKWNGVLKSNFAPALNYVCVSGQIAIRESVFSGLR